VISGLARPGRINQVDFRTTRSLWNLQLLPGVPTIMLKSGILNPDLLALLARFRHTNTIVIADRGFPFWPGIPTVDLSLVDDIPTVWQVLVALLSTCRVGTAWMASEFKALNPPPVAAEYQVLLEGVAIKRESHLEFKQRVPLAIGVIRTGDTTQYGNIVLELA